MARASDDELEAMAARLDVDDPWCQPLCYEAAAIRALAEKGPRHD